MKIRSQITALVAACLAASSPVEAVAQECTFEFRQTNSTGGLGSAQTLTLNAGEVDTQDRNFLREALNKGDHDIEIRIDQSGVSQTLTLINVEGTTLVVPPLPITGQQLQRVECKEHASYEDVRSYLDNFGQSAQVLYQGAMDDASAAIEEARQEALNAFDSDQASQWANQLKSMAGGAQASWDSIQALAGRTRPREVTLKSDFPEVANAIGLSEAYGTGLGDLLESAEQRAQQLSSDLNAFRSQWIDTEGATDFQFDFESQFPELAALSNLSCDIDAQPLVRYGSRLSDLGDQLARLDRVYGFSEAADAIALPSEVLQAIQESENRSDCSPAFDDLEASFSADAEGIGAWNERLFGALNRVPQRSRYLIPRELTRLIDVRGRYQQVRAAYQEVGRDRNVFLRRLVNARRVARSPNAGWQERAAHARATTVYHRAQEALGRRARDYHRARQAWVGTVRTTQQNVRRRRATSRAEESVAAVLGDLPGTELPLRLVEEAGQCLDDVLPLFDGVERALRSLETAARATLSPEIRAQMARVQRATRDAHRAGVISTADVNAAAASFLEIEMPVAALPPGAGTLTFPDPAQVASFGSQSWSDFQTDLNERLAQIGSRVEAFNSAAGDALPDLDRMIETHATLSTEIGTLAGMAGNRALRVPNDVGQFARTASGLIPRMSFTPMRDGMADCAELTMTRFAAAEGSLRTRVSDYRGVVEAAMTVEVPASVVAALGEVEDRHAEAVVAWEEANQEYMEANLAWAELSLAWGELQGDYLFLNFTLGTLATPADVEAAGENMAVALGKMIDELVDLGPALESLATTQLDLAKSISDLSKVASDELGDAVARSTAGQMAADLADIDYRPIEEAALSQDESRRQEIIDAWQSTSKGLPQRAAAVVPVVIANQIEEFRSTIEDRLSSLLELQNTFRQCHQSGQQANNALAEMEIGVEVAEGIAEAIRTEAQDVISDLQGLLTPTVNLLSTVGDVLDDAADLAAALEDVADDAAAAYADEVAADQAAAAAARQCITSQHFQITGVRDALAVELADLRERIEALQEFAGG